MPFSCGAIVGEVLPTVKLPLMRSFSSPNGGSSRVISTWGFSQRPAVPLRVHVSPLPSAGGLNVAPRQKPSPSLSLFVSPGQTSQASPNTSPSALSCAGSAIDGHTSSRSQTPSPSTSTNVQLALQQRSMPFSTPSSHASPALTTPLPHAVGVQLESHPSPLRPLPSSHCSLPVTSPSPHGP